MYSDTLIVVISLIMMIIVGLVFRTCCLKLAKQRVSKQRGRGGLRQLADHMNHVTRSMSNDLESPDSPKSVIRTYSNAARREGSVRHDRSLRVLAINNNYKGVEGEGGGGGGGGGAAHRDGGEEQQLPLSTDHR